MVYALGMSYLARRQNISDHTILMFWYMLNSGVLLNYGARSGVLEVTTAANPVRPHLLCRVGHKR
jgi:hypothetical protein